MSERASLSRVVSEQIRGRILDGTLKPGEEMMILLTTLSTDRSKIEELRKLGEIKKEGLLTYEEFTAQKQRLLS